MKPVNEHLSLKREHNPFMHLIKTITNKRHLKAFAATILLATGGYMLMPFAAAFSTANLKISLETLPMVYSITGMFTFFASPLAGRLSDKVGKMPVFATGSLLALILVVIFTNLGTTPLFWVIAVNVALFIPLTARMVAAQALITAVPEPANRGAFMGVNASMQQISGGLAASVAGMVVVKEPSGFLEHYDILGYVVAVTTIITIILMARVNKMVKAG
jgi:predicted MFS family arabinose efflux permease